jgi:hypothetical protein
MIDRNKNNMKKYAYYTLGLGMLLFGAAKVTPTPKMSPAEKSMHGPTTKRNKIPPIEATKHNSKVNVGHAATERSLSPKQKNVFHTLSKSDKQRVVDAHLKGKSTHREMTKILAEDKDMHDSLPKNPSPQGSPAERAIEKENMRKSKQNIYD